MQSGCWSAKLSICQAIYIPAHTYGHELWVATEGMRAESSQNEFPLSRLTLRDGVRSEDIPMVLLAEKSNLRLLPFYQDVLEHVLLGGDI